MNNKKGIATPLFLVIGIIIFIVAGVTVSGHIKNFFGNQYKIFNNTDLGYSFEYPANYTVSTDTISSYITVGKQNNNGQIDEEDSVIVLARYVTDEGSAELFGYKNFSEFAIVTAKNTCGNPDGSQSCTDVAVSKTFTNVAGLTGMEVYVSKVSENSGNNTFITKNFGPVYIFDILSTNPGKKYAALVIYPNHQFKPNTKLLKKIADSVKIQVSERKSINLPETSSWETYINEKVDYEIKVPPGAFLMEVPSGQSESQRVEKLSNNADSVFIRAWYGYVYLCYPTDCGPAGGPGVGTVMMRENVNLDGENYLAQGYFDQSEYGSVKIMMVGLKNNLELRYGFQAESELSEEQISKANAMVENMLSTFKFTR